MKFIEINAIYTAKVAEYISKGYIISTHTMTGHQGEIGKIDLTNGSEIVRISIQTTHCMEDCIFFADQIALTVSRTTNSEIMKAAETRETTIWTDNLEQVESPRIFWKMSYESDWYIEGDEGKTAVYKYYSRRTREQDLHLEKTYSGDELKTIAKIILPAVRRHLGKPKMKVDRIAVVRRFWNSDENRYHYNVITLGSNRVDLH